MKDRSDDPSHHEWTPLPQSYISLPKNKEERVHVIKWSVKSDANEETYRMPISAVIIKKELLMGPGSYRQEIMTVTDPRQIFHFTWINDAKRKIYLWHSIWCD